MFGFLSWLWNWGAPEPPEVMPGCIIGEPRVYDMITGEPQVVNMITGEPECTSKSSMT